jgi:DEAD/DEAH box helicase
VFRSLGLLLALLSKPRASRHQAPRYWKDRASRQVEVKEAITSILIVPHNDLALQFVQWIKNMRLTRDPNLLVQTLLKDSSEDYKDQLIRIGRDSPHILITTPKALDACWSKGKYQFTLDAVSTIVLEEADILLRVPSGNTPKDVQRRWRKHPPIVRELLADVFKLRPKNGPAPKIDNHYSLKEGSNLPDPIPVPKSVQLVLASATLRPAVRKFLFLETKWLSQESGKTLTIESTRAMDQRRDPVRHYGLFVDVSGSMRNLRDDDDEEDFSTLSDPTVASDPESDSETSEGEDEGVGEEDEGGFEQYADGMASPGGETCGWFLLKMPLYDLKYVWFSTLERQPTSVSTPRRRCVNFRVRCAEIRTSHHSVHRLSSKDS